MKRHLHPDRTERLPRRSPWTRRRGWLAVTAAVLPLAAAATLAQGPSRASVTEQVAWHLRTRIVAAGQPARLTAGGDILHAAEVLPAFYEERLFRPAWIGPGGRLDDAARELLAALADAPCHGLDAGAYHGEALAALRARLAAPGPRQPASPALLADLDLLLTDAFLTYGAHLVSGRVDPVSVDPLWHAARREVDLRRVLEEALAAGSPAAALEALLPQHPAYARLEEALARYRELAANGPWPEVPAGPALRREDSGERVTALRRRLRASAELPDGGDDEAAQEVFDQALEEAVRRFQTRHGLEPDGVVGEKTLSGLAVTPERRLHQIEVNLERWRWLPRDLGERYLLVDIAGFSLVLVEAGETKLDMRVVVGLSYRRTPVFSDSVRYLVLNPYWDVPTKIAVEDKLPEILADPTYLERMRMRVLEGWGADEREIDPATVDWTKLGPGRFPYHLRQDPGPANALGRIKFMFPNAFSVYLHDTPTRRLFGRADRAASSGCIRVEKALDLAVKLLQDSPGWSREALEAAIATGEERMVPLPRPVPVHLLYWTAAVAEDGTVQFRNDIYGRDTVLDEALHERPVEP